MRLRTPAPLSIFFALSMAVAMLAGCIGGEETNPASSSGEEMPVSEIQINKGHLDDQAWSVVVDIVVLGDANISIGYGNGRPDSSPSGARNACGAVNYEIQGEDWVGGNGFGWSESNGRAAMIAAGEEPVVVEGGIGERLYLDGDFDDVDQWNLEQGDRIRLVLSLQGGNESRFEPYIQMDANESVLLVEQSRKSSFTCQSNLQSFSGEFATVLMQTVVVQAAFTYSTTEATTAEFLFLPHHSFPGTCTIGLRLGEEEVVDRAEPSTDFCYVSIEGGAGEVTAFLENSSYYGGAMVLWIWDRAE